MKRRLNIAAAVLHEPELVLLDEPTVGVDPQSRNAIFDSIEALKAQGRTLVYSTHYMEEAVRLCDRVAIIDAGKVLALDTVPGLIRTHGGTPTLHVPGWPAVTSCCRRTTRSRNSIACRSRRRSNRSAWTSRRWSRSSSRLPVAPCETERPAMSAMLAIAIKDLRTFTPSARVAVLHVRVAALRRRAVRRAVRRQRQADPAAAHRRGGRGQDRRLDAPLPIGWSKRDTFDGDVAASRAEALEAVRKGERIAAVMLRPGFGEASSRMFYGTPPEVQLYTDPSRQAERGMLEGLLMQQGAERMQAMFSNPAGGRQNVQAALQDLARGAARREPRPRDVPRPTRHVPRYARRRALAPRQRAAGTAAAPAGSLCRSPRRTCSASARARAMATT